MKKKYPRPDGPAPVFQCAICASCTTIWNEDYGGWMCGYGGLFDGYRCVPTCHLRPDQDCPANCTPLVRRI